MFFYSLQFLKVSAKNIYYCGQKPGGYNTAHLLSNEVSQALKLVPPCCKIYQNRNLFKNFQKCSRTSGHYYCT